MNKIKEAIEQLNMQIKCTVVTVSIKSCKTAIEALEKQLNNNWIPIHNDSDYPKTKGYYFITRECGETDYVYWQKTYKDCWKSMGIIAYMEKPQKYEVTL